MLPASNRGAGQSLGFPDVCNTPAGPATVPIPYPNIALNAQAVGFSVTVKISGVNALNMNSKIPMTSGDEGGVAHSTIKGQAAYTMGNPVVNIDKSPAINLICPGTGNNSNCPLNAVVVPSAVTVMFCRRSAAPAEPVQEQLAAGDQMSRPAIDTTAELPGGARYVKLGRIAPGAASELFAALSAGPAPSSKPEPKALVLDLRDNAGGTLDAALQLGRFFLPEGCVIATLIEPDSEQTTVRSLGPPACSLPLSVLINGGTASAAELLAACLQDHHRALIVGRRSFGKTTAYRYASQAPGRFAALRWRRPGQGRGAPERIVPDVPAAGAAALRAAWALALELAQTTP